MERIQTIFVYLIGGISTLTGGWATLQLLQAAWNMMRKNQRKVEEAKEHIEHIVIGIVIAVAGAAIVNWLMSA
jgi:ABC-type nickel/cobalt efflux system permease component RcnA